MTDPEILVLGPPGAGKGTQAEHIARAYDVEHIDAGEVLRRHEKRTLPGELDKADTLGDLLDTGELVPDEIVNELIGNRITRAEGFVLDGYPRTMGQAESFDRLTTPDVIFFLDVDREEVIDRLKGRRIDPETGKTYHVEHSLPDDPEVRDRLTHRTDDTPEAIRQRFNEFEQQTAPVIDHYRNRKQFVCIDAGPPPDEVWRSVRSAIDKEVESGTHDK